MQPLRVVPSEAMQADQLRTANRLRSRAENLITFAGDCLTKTSVMNRSQLFLTDDCDGLLTLDAARNRLKLTMC